MSAHDLEPGELLLLIEGDGSNDSIMTAARERAFVLFLSCRGSSSSGWTTSILLLLSAR